MPLKPLKPLKRVAICCIQQVRIVFGRTESCLKTALFRALYHTNDPPLCVLDFSTTNLRGSDKL